MMTTTPWIIVSDFDGTLTQKDIGNEICKLFIPDLFKRLHADYYAGRLNLRELQAALWTNFPCSQELFIQSSLRVASLRPGVNEFLEHCAHKQIPFYIASCGMDLYFQTVIDRFFSKFSQAAVLGMACNKIEFDDTKLVKITPPDENPLHPEPLHKGQWAKSLSEKHGGAKIIAIGNGGSDRTFLGYSDVIFATEKLVKTCEDAGQAYTPFDNFFDILKKLPL